MPEGEQVTKAPIKATRQVRGRVKGPGGLGGGGKEGAGRYSGRVRSEWGGAMVGGRSVYTTSLSRSRNSPLIKFSFIFVISRYVYVCLKVEKVVKS